MSAEKESEALALGAHTFVVSTNATAMAECVDSLDFIYYLVPYDIDWELYMSILRRNGTLCVMAGAPSPMSIRTTSLFLPNNHKRIVGRNIGPAAWHLRMLEFAALHNIKAVVESFPLGEVNEVVERVKRNAVRFRAVLTHEGQFTKEVVGSGASAVVPVLWWKKKKKCTLKNVVHVQVHVATHTLQMYGIVHCTVVPTI
jgi:D-arabinose 1-dehydrogenase-like Zn-dependent alcohol dehydrogenase